MDALILNVFPIHCPFDIHHSHPRVKIFAIEGQIDRPNHRMCVMRKKEGRKERSGNLMAQSRAFPDRLSRFLARKGHNSGLK